MALGHGIAVDETPLFSNPSHTCPTCYALPSLCSNGSTPKVGQPRGEPVDGGRDGVAVAGTQKAAQAGVPAAKIDGRLAVRFVACPTVFCAVGSVGVGVPHALNRR